MSKLHVMLPKTTCSYSEDHHIPPHRGGEINETHQSSSLYTSSSKCLPLSQKNTHTRTYSPCASPGFAVNPPPSPMGTHTHAPYVRLPSVPSPSDGRALPDEAWEPSTWRPAPGPPAVCVSQWCLLSPHHDVVGTGCGGCFHVGDPDLGGWFKGTLDGVDVCETVWGKFQCAPLG